MVDRIARRMVAWLGALMDRAAAETYWLAVRRGLMGVPDRSALTACEALEREFRRMVRELEDTRRHEVPKETR